LINLAELILLGAIAGLTIFFGLPVALFGASERTKGFLNALAVGILIFLIVDVFGSAWAHTTDAVISAFQEQGSPLLAAADLGAMFGGLAVGLVGLVVYGRAYLGKVEGAQVVDGRKMAMMIALGIGAHNLSEGLAIGQSYVSGAIGLAIVLVVGFGAHNTTEGFGIMAPLAGMKPSLSFLVRVLLIGGAPTFLGTILGSLYFSPVAYVLFLSLAGGALVYVTMMMYNTGRRRHGNELMMTGVFIGLCAGFLTDLIVSLGGA